MPVNRLAIELSFNKLFSSYLSHKKIVPINFRALYKGVFLSLSYEFERNLTGLLFPAFKLFVKNTLSAILEKLCIKNPGYALILGLL